jgi:hypothetical protein
MPPSAESTALPRSWLAGTVRLPGLPAQLAAVLLVLGGCGEAPEAPPLPPDPLSPEESEYATALGAPAAAALAEGLVGRLAQAIDEDGLEGAMAFCSDAAIPLTREIQEARAGGVALKRTTLRWRNPDNAPDEWEERVLLYLEALEALDPGSVPVELTARGPGETVRYYRTLRTAPMCLDCHGAEESVGPEVRDLLRERYPADRATGYRAGELRGVIRAEMSRR